MQFILHRKGNDGGRIWTVKHRWVPVLTERGMDILYTDDFIPANPNKEDINKPIIYIKNAELKIMIEVDLQGFLSMSIEGWIDKTEAI